MAVQTQFPSTMPVYVPGTYVTVAASASGAALGAAGAIGNILSSILVIPATTSPGSVKIIDGSTSITVFAGGASSVSNLAPIHIPIFAFSKTGAWTVTTGGNLSVIAVGLFT